jgi:hypothetical protein
VLGVLLAFMYLCDRGTVGVDVFVCSGYCLRSCICVLEVLISSLSTMFVLGFRTVPSVWYFLFFILLLYILYVFMKEEFEDIKGR